MATLALLDASNYLYRAFYAIRGLTGPGGRPTNAVYGFLNMWRKYREVRKPDAVAVAFDRYEKTFREEMDATYKAQRQAMPDDLVPQIEDAKRLCRLLGLAVVEEAGFEADDLIGSIAVAASGAGVHVEIASADKDLFQLVKDDAVVVWHPTQERLLDEAGVTEFFGVPPGRVVDVLALMGDSSDNIPGVRGIGEKTAKELMATFGSLEDIYARLEEVKGKRIAIPGTLTTAYLAAKLFEPDFEAVVTPFDQITNAVRDRAVDCGLIIHEAQLTYDREGFHRIVDLGRWFKATYDLPLPLGGNVLLRSLGAEMQSECCRLMRESIQYALDNHDEALQYALQFARDMEPRLAEKFVGMYVNHYTLDAGEVIPKAAQKLLDLGFEAGVISKKVEVEFAR